MDDTRERLIRLEEALAYSNDLTAYRFAEHERRLLTLESKPDTITRVMGPGGWFKLGLALALLLLTLMATGDIGAAVRAARMAGPG